MDFQAITDLAKEMLLETGEFRPTVFMEMEDDQHYVLPFMSFPFRNTEERSQALFMAARKLAKKQRKKLKNKQVLSIAFACEGWASQYAKDSTEMRVRPSLNPARKEVLFITMLTVSTMQQEMSVYEMLRAGDSLDLVTMTEKPDEVQSSLLPSFLAGIQTAEQDEGMARAKLRRVREEYGVKEV